MRVQLLVAVVVAATSWGTKAQAAEFGDSGTVVVAGGAALLGSSSEIDGPTEYSPPRYGPVQRETKTSATALVVGPTVSYFFGPGLAVRGGITLVSASAKSRVVVETASDAEISTYTVGGSLGLAGYIKGGDHLWWVIAGDVGGGKGSAESTVSGSPSETSDLSKTWITGEVGLAIPFGGGGVLEVLGQVTSATTEIDLPQNDSTKASDLTFGVATRLGVFF